MNTDNRYTTKVIISIKHNSHDNTCQSADTAWTHTSDSGWAGHCTK